MKHAHTQTRAHTHTIHIHSTLAALTNGKCIQTTNLNGKGLIMLNAGMMWIKRRESRERVHSGIDEIMLREMRKSKA